MHGRMNRRAFVTGLGAVLAAPCAVGAQRPGKIATVGVLAASGTDDPEFRVLWEAFVSGLRNYGWIENQNMAFARRNVVDSTERYSRPAAELVALQPDI